jgi:hypothetical protein
MYVSVSALAVALISLMIAVMNYRRGNAKIDISVNDVRTRTKPLDVEVRMRLFNGGLAEIDVVSITFWMFYKQWPLSRKFIDGEALPARLKANSSREWSISLLDALASAYRGQVEDMGASGRRYFVRFVWLAVLHYTSYLYTWIPSIRTMLPPTLLVQLGNGRVVKRTVWRAAFALTKVPEVAEYALRSKPSTK